MTQGTSCELTPNPNPNIIHHDQFIPKLTPDH